MNAPNQTPVRLGVVSYLNAKPLIAGLHDDPGVRLFFDVPAKLPRMLESGEVDVALVPVIDVLRRGAEWKIISDACIGCDGETFTVRVFCKGDPSALTCLHADADSHSSVILAQVIWRELYGRQLEILPYAADDQNGPEPRAILLIGDKVVTRRPIGFDVEVDLGSAWKSLTGLPFVFAAWAAPADAEVEAVAARLNAARDLGEQTAKMIAADLGPGMGWPVALATRYLTRRLVFRLGSRQREAMKRFAASVTRLGFVQENRELLFA